MYSLTLQPYDYPFRRPLRTHHGLWKRRQGLLIKLSDGQREGWGEIAPLPDFGSESLEAAHEFCQGFQGHLDDGDIFSIGDRYPACQFALESAREALLRYPNPPFTAQLPLLSASPHRGGRPQAITNYAQRPLGSLPLFQMENRRGGNAARTRLVSATPPGPPPP